MQPLLPRLLCVLIGSMVFSLAVQVEAQIVRIHRGSGVSVNAPGVHVQVGPVGVAGRAYVPGRRRFFARRAYLGQPPTAAQARGTGAPQYVPAPATSTSGPTLAEPENYEERSFPTKAELAALDDAMLLNALLDATSRLNARLARLTTGAGWQRYLRLPADALPPPAEDGAVKLGINSIRHTLNRFDQVAANPEFTKIATLPSFVATRSALRQVVERIGKLQPALKLNAPATHASATQGGSADQGVLLEKEILPAPEPASQTTAPAGERSIIKR